MTTTTIILNIEPEAYNIGQWVALVKEYPEGQENYEIVITGPSGDVWTVEATDSTVALSELEDAVERYRQWVVSNQNNQLLTAKLSPALVTNNTFLAISEPDLADIVNQVKALTKQANMLIRFRKSDFLDISDT